MTDRPVSPPSELTDKERRIAALLAADPEAFDWVSEIGYTHGQRATVAGLEEALAGLIAQVVADAKSGRVPDDRSTVWPAYVRGYINGTIRLLDAARAAPQADAVLREALAQAIEGGWEPASIDPGLYHNDPVFHAVVYTVRHAALAAAPVPAGLDDEEPEENPTGETAGEVTGVYDDIMATAIAALKWAWLGWTDTAPADDPRRIEAVRNAGKSLAAEYRRIALLAAAPQADEALRAALLSIHKPQDGLRRLHPRTKQPTDQICWECDRPWPCDTFAALTQSGASDQNLNEKDPDGSSN